MSSNIDFNIYLSFSIHVENKNSYIYKKKCTRVLFFLFKQKGNLKIKTGLKGYTKTHLCQGKKTYPGNSPITNRVSPVGIISLLLWLFNK